MNLFTKIGATIKNAFNLTNSETMDIEDAFRPKDHTIKLNRIEPSKPWDRPTKESDDNSLYTGKSWDELDAFEQADMDVWYHTLPNEPSLQEMIDKGYVEMVRAGEIKFTGEIIPVRMVKGEIGCTKEKIMDECPVDKLEPCECRCDKNDVTWFPKGEKSWYTKFNKETGKVDVFEGIIPEALDTAVNDISNNIDMDILRSMRIDGYIDNLKSKGFENTRLSNVSLIDTTRSNTDEQGRIEYISSIAIITRGLTEIKEERKPKLYQDLLVEGFGKTANRVFEFLPVVLKDVSFEGLCLTFEDISSNSVTLTKEQSLNILKYSYYDIDANIIYTNMRCLLKAGIPYESVPYNTEEDLNNFKVIDMNIPMYIWAQLYTHTQLSKLSESDRVSKNPCWDVNSLELPEDFINRIVEHIILSKKVIALYKKGTCDINDEEWVKFKTYELFQKNDFKENPTIELVKEYLIKYMSSDDLYKLFKLLGYKKEICSRAIYYMRLKHSLFAGWKCDPNVWDNLVNERTNSWTQEDTKVIANQIKELIK